MLTCVSRREWYAHGVPTEVAFWTVCYMPGVALTQTYFTHRSRVMLYKNSFLLQCVCLAQLVPPCFATCSLTLAHVMLLFGDLFQYDNMTCMYAYSHMQDVFFHASL
jgi:hypothetical protein